MDMLALGGNFEVGSITVKYSSIQVHMRVLQKTAGRGERGFCGYNDLNDWQLQTFS